MNLKFYSILSIAISVIVFVSCKSANKLYENGRYDEAVGIAAKKTSEGS